MNILTWEISLTKEQLGYEKLTPPASVSYETETGCNHLPRRRIRTSVRPGG